MSFFFINFSSTVSSLHSRVDSLEKSNTKLIEELAIAKNNIIKLQEENHQLRSENKLILMKTQQHLEVSMDCLQTHCLVSEIATFGDFCIDWIFISVLY